MNLGNKFILYIILILYSNNLSFADDKIVSTPLINLEKIKPSFEEINEQNERKLLDTITKKYKEQTSPFYAASRLWIDAIIDPTQTRQVISMGINAANNAPITKAYNPGIIQS